MALIDSLTDADIEGIHEALRITSGVRDLGDLTASQILPPGPRAAIANLAKAMKQDKPDALAEQVQGN